MNTTQKMFEHHKETLREISRIIAKFNGMDHETTHVGMIHALQNVDIKWFKDRDVMTYILVTMPPHKSAHATFWLLGELLSWYKMIKI